MSDLVGSPEDRFSRVAAHCDLANVCVASLFRVSVFCPHHICFSYVSRMATSMGKN